MNVLELTGGFVV